MFSPAPTPEAQYDARMANGMQAGAKAAGIQAHPEPGTLRTVLNALTGYPLPGEVGTAADVAMAAAPLLPLGRVVESLAAEGKAGSAAARGITAYHGSPHDFDKFALDKIGSGEGAQAYGHGLYFADNEGTARTYRDALGGDALHLPNGDRVKPTPGSVEDRALAFLATYSGGGMGISDPYAFARKEVQKLIDNGTGSNRPGEIDTLKAIKDKLWEWQQAGVSAGSGGKMYQVRINADPEQMLDWDKPLKDQSPAVKALVNDTYRGQLKTRPVGNGMVDVHLYDRGGSIGVFPESKVPEVLNNPADYLPFDGKATYDQIVARTQRPGPTPDWGMVPDKPTASQRLKDAGVPGIKYLDQGSRAAGEGSRNYVVFDDKLIDILKKYGLLPAAMAGGAMSQQHAPTKP